jgi:hypothetical protein
VNGTTMNGPCEDCTHYRPPRDLRKIYRIPLTRGTAQVAQEVMEVQRQINGAEEAAKTQLLLTDSERWPHKPQVQPYCGLREAAGEYLVHQVKNVNQRCKEWKPATETPASPCSTCIHHRPPGGQARDASVLLDVVSPSNWFFSTGEHPAPLNRIDNEIDIAIGTSQLQQGHETLMALHGAGTLPQRPEYFSWCQQFSSAERYVLCAAENQHCRCHGWSDGRPVSPPGRAGHGSRPDASRSGRRATAGSRGSTLFTSIARRIAAELNDTNRARRNDP